MKSKKSILQNIYVILISSLLTLFFLELFVRQVIDDGKRFEFEMTKYAKNLKNIDKSNTNIIGHLPNKKIKIMGVEVITDSDGFRINKIEKQHEKKIKVLMLGDSVTFGFGSSKTFSDYLNEEFKKYKFINSGVGNTNTIMQIERFFIKLKKVNPDIIILNFFINDLEKVIYKKEKWYHNLYLYNLIMYNSKVIMIKLGFNKNNKKFYKETFRDNEIIEKTFKKINQLDVYAKKNNIIFFVNIIPDFRYLQDYPFLEEEKILINFFLNSNIKYVQGIKYLSKSKSENYWVSETDPHPNEKGHKLIAGYLTEFLKKFYLKSN